MRKYKYLILCFACLCGLATVSCGDDDDVLPEEELPGGGQGEDDPQNGGNGSGEEVVTPGLDGESLKFVGAWRGIGPSAKSQGPSYNPVEGTWYFKNDSTYQFGSETGKWRYNAENKMLITDNRFGFVWQILELTDGTWLGTLLNEKGGTYTYTRENTSMTIHTGRLQDINQSDITVSYTLSKTEYATESYKYGICISTDRNLPEGQTNYYYEDTHSEDTLIQIPNMELNTTYYYSAVIDINGRKIYGDTLEYTHHYYDNAVFMGGYSANGKPLFVAKGNLIMRSDGSAYIAPSGDYMLNRSYSEGIDEWDRFQWGDATGMRTEQSDVVSFYKDTYDLPTYQDIASTKLGGLWRMQKVGENPTPASLCEGEGTFENNDRTHVTTWTNKLSGKSVTYIQAKNYYHYEGSWHGTYRWTSFWTSTGYRLRSDTRPYNYEHYAYVYYSSSDSETRQYDFNFIRPVTE